MNGSDLSVINYCFVVLLCLKVNKTFLSANSF